MSLQALIEKIRSNYNFTKDEYEILKLIEVTEELHSAVKHLSSRDDLGYWYRTIAENSIKKADGICKDVSRE